MKTLSRSELKVLNDNYRNADASYDASMNKTADISCEVRKTADISYDAGMSRNSKVSCDVCMSRNSKVSCDEAAEHNTI